MGFLHSTHLHTEVLGFDNDHHSKRVEGVLDAVFDLRGHTLLHLQTAGEDVHYTGYLAQARDFTVRDICHMGFAEERQHVVLTEGIEINVFDYHHLAVILLKECGTEYGFGVFLVTFGKELQGFAHSVGCLLQAGAMGIFPQSGQYLIYLLLELLSGSRIGIECLQVHGLCVVFIVFVVMI